MKAHCSKMALFPFAVLFFFSAAAQTDSNSKKAHFKIGLNYNSNLNYYGRTDSLQSSGVFPLAEFWVAENFYVNAAPIFINNAVQRMNYAGTVATLGFQHATDDWFSHFYLLKPFYKEETNLVQSTLKAQTGFSISNLNPIFNITAGADVKWSDALDLGATAGLDRAFRLEDKSGGIWVINPSLFLYAGTQRFSQTYTKLKKGVLMFRGREETITEKSSSFKVLAYEASLPFIFAKGAWQFTVTPTYVIPQNLLQVPNQPQLSEKGKKTFYATLGAKYAF
jgi:hypothetical protein